MDDIDGGNAGGESEGPTDQVPPTPAADQPTPPSASEAPTAPTAAPPPTPPFGVPGPRPFAAEPGLGGGYLPPPTDAGGPGYWQSGWAPTSQGWAPPRPVAQSGGGSAGRTLALLFAAVLLLVAGVAIGHGLWSPASGPASSLAPTIRPVPRVVTPPTSPAPASGAPSDVTAIASKVDPGLVDINTTLSFQGEQAAGTGMVLTSSGEILTNNHVIDEATSISVTDVGNGQTYGATVVGYDDTSDLAVLQLHGASGLQTVSIGNSAHLSVGQSVVGIGNAGGTGGTPSSAGGSITALNQTITASDGGGNSEQLTNLIESNADIQPGDSGGPLVNDSGQVLAIDTAASAGFQFQGNAAEGYSIPINGAIAIAKQIEAGHGSATIHIGLTAFLGVTVEPAGGSGTFGGGPFGAGGSTGGGSQATGAVVAGVVTGDPADSAGISMGDTITTFAGSAVASPSALTAALVPHHPGDKVQIAWTDQSGQSHTATVQLASGPPA